MTSVRAPRLSRDARRTQLLDVARVVLADRGVSGFTMESLAAAAGVNKAIPYRHFDNAQAVLLELRRDFNLEIASRVEAAAAGGGTTEERVRDIVRAYFTTVRDNADVLALLNTPGVAVDDPEADRPHIAFATRLFVEHFGVGPREAAALAGLVTGALQGAAESWAAGDASRTRIESALVVAITAAVEAALTR